MRTNDFDTKFENTQSDILDDLDLSTITKPNRALKKVNVDFLAWMVNQLDKKAKRLGVALQSIIKICLAEHLAQSAYVLIAY